MTDPRLREAIASSQWFCEIPDDAIDRLASAAVVRHMPVSSYIYSQGEKTTELYCILKGRVRVSISGFKGEEFAIVDREDGEWFGEPCLIDDEPRVIDAQVLAASEVLVLPRAIVREIIEEHPIVYRALFTQSFQNMRGLYTLIAGILFSPLRVRVAGRLVQFIEEHGVETDDGILIDIKVSQNEFARLALGSRQRVNAIFSEWRARGFVETRDDHLLITDRSMLEAEMQIDE
ncbi:MAG: Crp/Fnr family transcriptional regulator [Halieaceae bacterium]